MAISNTVLPSYLDKYSGTSLSLKDIPDFQLSNMWVLQMNDFPNFDFYIDSSNLPLPQLELETNNLNLITPGKKNNLSSFSITFIETVNFDGYNYFINWLQDVYDFNKQAYNVGFHSKKKIATIKFISSEQNMSNKTSSLIQNQEFQLWGLMIKGISDIDLGNSDGDPIKFTVEMEAQKVTLNIPSRKLI